MYKIVIALTRISGTNRQYLSFTQTGFDKDGIELQRKVGFKEISPEVNAENALAAAQKREWHFGVQNARQGTYEVLAGPANAVVRTTSDELEHQA